MLVLSPPPPAAHLAGERLLRPEANRCPSRLSVLHIFKVYYPDLFGGTLSVIRDICAELKESFSAAVLVCSRSDGEGEIIVDDVKVERVRSFGDVLSLPAAPSYRLRPQPAPGRALACGHRLACALAALGRAADPRHAAAGAGDHRVGPRPHRQ